MAILSRQCSVIVVGTSFLKNDFGLDVPSTVFVGQYDISMALPAH
jgi:hypothetical protein